MITKEQRLAFLHDLQAVCGKHNLSLGHEDGHGAFLIQPYGDVYVEWLNAAYVEDENRPKQELLKEKAEVERDVRKYWEKEKKRKEELKKEKAITKHYPTIF